MGLATASTQLISATSKTTVGNSRRELLFSDNTPTQWVTKAPVSDKKSPLSMGVAKILPPLTIARKNLMIFCDRNEKEIESTSLNPEGKETNFGHKF